DELLARRCHGEASSVASRGIRFGLDEAGLCQHGGHTAHRWLGYAQSFGQGALRGRVQLVNEQQREESPVGQVVLGPQDAVGGSIETRGQRMKVETQVAIHSEYISMLT